MYLLQIKLICGLNGVLNLKEYFFLYKDKIQSIYESEQQHLTWCFSWQHIRLQQSEMQCSESTKHTKAVGFKETI